jgi:hypothetical protein
MGKEHIMPRPPKPPKPAGREAAPRSKRKNGLTPRHQPTKGVQMATAESKKLLKELPSDAEMKATMLGMLRHADDKAAAITAAAHLEYALEIMIKAFIRPLNGDDERRMFDGAAGGIIGGMSSEILMAFALKLISEDQYRDFKLINDIRNVFAHTLHRVDFNNEDIKADCKKLKTFNPRTVDAPKNAKEKYIQTILYLYFKIRMHVDRHAASEMLRGIPGSRREPHRAVD